MSPEPAIAADLVIGALIKGAILAMILIALAHVLRRNRREILFASLLVAALAYVLFAVRAQAGAGWIIVELIGLAIYGGIGWRGVRGSIWWLASAWALHPLWDIALHYFGPGVSFVHPLRYPVPCVSFDLVVATYLGYLASRESTSPRTYQPPIL